MVYFVIMDNEDWSEKRLMLPLWSILWLWSMKTGAKSAWCYLYGPFYDHGQWRLERKALDATFMVHFVIMDNEDCSEKRLMLPLWSILWLRTRLSKEGLAVAEQVAFSLAVGCMLFPNIRLDLLFVQSVKERRNTFAVCSVGLRPTNIQIETI
jgi:hypothetical protein